MFQQLICINLHVDFTSIKKMIRWFALRLFNIACITNYIIKWSLCFLRSATSDIVIISSNTLSVISGKFDTKLKFIWEIGKKWWISKQIWGFLEKKLFQQLILLITILITIIMDRVFFIYREWSIEISARAIIHSSTVKAIIWKISRFYAKTKVSSRRKFRLKCFFIYQHK